MPDGTGMHLTEFIPEYTVEPEDYSPFIGQKRIEELKRLAAPVQKKGWANVNSTLVGGGVAEILKGVIPFARSLGVDANWYVIEGKDEFFTVTKKFHNMLQGVDQPIDLKEIFHAYLHTIDENTRNMFIASDLVVIHDPQPAAMVMNGVIFGNVIWRCHIDTSAPNNIVWRFLLPYINHCAGAVFTMPEFTGPGLQVPLYQITPCIDPLATKNRHCTEAEALDILQPLFNEHNIDPGRPIIAAVSRYDIHKNQATIIQAFKKLREDRKNSTPPYLIFVGNTASDDPEGGAMLEKLKEIAGDDKDIRFWVNVDNNDNVLRALLHLAKLFVQVSTKEGFGLVVTEALWQSTPVIGSSAGGIKLQVIDGQNGFVVDPLDVPAIAHNMARLIDDPQQAKIMGENAKLHVQDNFLLPELVRRYFILLRYYTHIDKKTPEFRLNELTLNEVINTIRPRPQYVSK